MAAKPHQGKFFILVCFLFILGSQPLGAFANSSSVPTHQEPEEAANESNPQDILLQRLEELVRNLSDLVAKLEPKLLEYPKTVTLDSQESQERDKTDRRRKVSGDEMKGESKNRDGEKMRAVSVTKFSPLWSERFHFVSAVKLDSDATCIDVLPFRDYEGLNKYVAVGDDKGRVYVFSSSGDVLVEFDTKCDSPITAMTSYLSVYKNESFVVTGHQNGEILMHKVYESSNWEELTSLFMVSVSKFALNKNGDEGYAITILEMHHFGRLKYVLSSDANGMIRVFRENGTIHGSAMPVSKPLAFLKQKLLFLTENGAGSLDMRTMTVRESECEGSNHSLVRSFAFDSTERSKAYGFTSDGDLIHVLLLGDAMNFKCRVKSKRKVDLLEPIAFKSIKGYLLVVNQEKVLVYNVSSHHYVRAGGPRLLFSAGLDEIRSSFLNYQATEDDSNWKNPIPLIAGDHEKLIILGLGNGFVGIYRSNLPIFKGEFNTMLWTSPVIFFLIFLFGAWQFFAKKREALTSWGPDDPFTSNPARTGVPLGSASSFVESSSRNADVMDLRAGGLRGPPRRYLSPSRYPGGATAPFRPSSADTNTASFRPSSTDANARSTSVDPNYRAPAELKYRGPTLESTGFPKRRESLYGNSQVDDGN
ncbi:hypothetical protein K2173_007401 [Erythroxylum novogranatense]|uniref:Uncharacterized protein n=1 Tax=Erythroxylum novogranatense TaxID=1862640 RepID=A0AAV8T7L8_9ROSI|nr:hypothetical protein K2173_007401 [Erythroxylum novogranatense]